MKIYFAGSIRGGRQDALLYRDIIQLLEAYGTVLTEHIGLEDLAADGEKGKTDQQIFERDLAWLKESDAVVAEVTSPSLGVGWEIATAEHQGTPVLCLFRPETGGKVSAMLSGNPYVQVTEYKLVEELPQVLDRFFNRDD